MRPATRRAETEQDKQAAEAAEDGWTLVRRKRPGAALTSVADPAVQQQQQLEQQRKRKRRGDPSGLDFYRFQRREHLRDQVGERRMCGAPQEPHWCCAAGSHAAQVRRGQAADCRAAVAAQVSAHVMTILEYCTRIKRRTRR
jgi:hypothetical protein